MRLFTTAHALRPIAAAVITVMLALPGAVTVSRAQERQVIAGTTVSLVPAAGFARANGFSGLQNTETSAALVVAELPPEAFGEVSKLFADIEAARKNFAKQNVEVERRDTIEIAGETVPLLVGTQKMGAFVFDKWMTVLKGERTVVLTVQAPQQAKLDPAAVRAMLASVALGKPPTVAEKLAELPFRVAATEPFRVVDALAGATVLMTAGPLDVDPQGSQPLIVVSYQLTGSVSPKNLAETATRLLRNTRGFQQAELAAPAPVRFAGHDGVAVSGTYEGQDGARRRVLQLMSVGEKGRYLRLIASGPEARFKEVEAQITAVADSVRFAD